MNSEFLVVLATAQLKKSNETLQSVGEATLAYAALLGESSEGIWANQTG